MKKLPLVLMFCAAPALAQISVTPGEPATSPAQSQPASQEPQGQPVRRAVPVKAATPAPKIAPAPKSESSGGFFGFFRRLFGGGHAKQEVTAPKPGATPKPTATPKASATPKAAATPKPAVTLPKPSATPTPVATPVPASSPKPARKMPTPSPTPAAISQDAVEIPVPAVRSPQASDPSEAQYQKIKQQALKDPNVSELHEKMVALLSAHPEGGAAYKAAASEYTAALFAKMRKLDPANVEQIDRKEGATKRRLDAGLPIVQ